MAQQQGTTGQSPPYSTYFDDPTFSDVTIKLRGRDVRVHRIVLRRNSKYFANFLTGRFMPGGGSQEISLDDDNPDAIVPILRYIYGLPYATDDPKWRDGVSLLPQVWVYLTTGKYQIEGLQDEVLQAMSSILARNDWSDAGRNNRVFEATSFLMALRAMIGCTSLNDDQSRDLFVDHCIDNKSEFMKSRTYCVTVSTYIRELWVEIVLCEEGEDVIDTSAGSPTSERVFNMRGCLALCEERFPRGMFQANLHTVGFTRSEHGAFLVE